MAELIESLGPLLGVESELRLSEVTRVVDFVESEVVLDEDGLPSRAGDWRPGKRGAQKRRDRPPLGSL
jgi:hypothetical protein